MARLLFPFACSAGKVVVAALLSGGTRPGSPECPGACVASAPLVRPRASPALGTAPQGSRPPCWPPAGSVSGHVGAPS